MSNEINFILTNSAAELISKVLNGKTLNFTRMAVGDGFSYNTEIAKGYKTLINEVLSLDITKKEILSPSSIKITSAFKNTDAQKEFYYREVGLYAEDPDTGQEVLYAYGNRNDAAELITPTGANIVTKQLIFIIAVGDSANVTFNVNADVYALQSDMLDVQENIEQIQTNLGKTQTNITNLQSSKANRNLNNTGMVTNCLLEVPQRIKYELTNGILTVKAGSVVIVPYGVEDLTVTYPVGSTFLHKNFKVVDTQYSNDNKFFIWVELQNDINYNYEIDISQKWIHLVPSTSGLRSMLLNFESSGPEAPTNYFNKYACWYDTVNNYVKWTDTSMSTWTICTFPIFLYTIGQSVDIVFNGMGYMGSTIWVDKGVKGLIPNGRNPDGSLNNIEWEQSSFYARTLLATDDDYIATFGLDGSSISRNKDTRIVFNGDLNLNLMNGDPWLYTTCGTFTQTAGVVLNFELKKPFKIMDYNDYSKKIKEIETRISALESI